MTRVRRKQVMRILVVTLVLTVALSAPSRAAESLPADPVLEQATGLAGALMFLESGAPGMVLVTVRGDHSLVRGYGETEKGNNHTPKATACFA